MYETRYTGASPFSFTISVLGSFTCIITQHTGRTALRPIRRTKQLWSSVLPKDTSAATGQAGIRTHILTTPELESSAPDRSATTLLNCVLYYFMFIPEVYYLHEVRQPAVIHTTALYSKYLYILLSLPWGIMG